MSRIFAQLIALTLFLALIHAKSQYKVVSTNTNTTSVTLIFKMILKCILLKMSTADSIELPKNYPSKKVHSKIKIYYSTKSQCSKNSIIPISSNTMTYILKQIP